MQQANLGFFGKPEGPVLTGATSYHFMNASEYKKKLRPTGPAKPQRLESIRLRHLFETPPSLALMLFHSTACGKDGLLSRLFQFFGSEALFNLSGKA